jgi:hypothetical protein
MGQLDFLQPARGRLQGHHGIGQGPCGMAQQHCECIGIWDDKENAAEI